LFVVDVVFRYKEEKKNRCEKIKGKHNHIRCNIIIQKQKKDCGVKKTTSNYPFNFILKNNIIIAVHVNHDAVDVGVAVVVVVVFDDVFT